MKRALSVFGASLLLASLLLASCGGGAGARDEAADALNTAKPQSTVKLCFIHHSTGSDWIRTGGGKLGTALNANNYFVTECDYGWNADPGDGLGDCTDTVDWPAWFTDAKMPYVYANEAHYDYDNTIDEPAGENTIVVFKSCFPNSEVGVSIEDEKGVYESILGYFGRHQEKMFVLIVPPPEISIESAALTRELSNWLVDREDGWLSSYGFHNVYAFNYYNILTDPDNHHRVNASNREENVVAASPADAERANELYYYAGSDDHPTADGHLKATDEFIPLLNAWYNNYRGR